MKTSYITLLALAIAFLLMGMKMQETADILTGRWQLNTKIEKETEDGVVTESSEKSYPKGKKSFEFSPGNKLVISDDYGKVKEKKKYVLEDKYVYIGKEKSLENRYTITLNGNQLTLFRTKTKDKKGKTRIETDELKFEKLP